MKKKETSPTANIASADFSLNKATLPGRETLIRYSRNQDPTAFAILNVILTRVTMEIHFDDSSPATKAGFPLPENQATRTTAMPDTYYSL